MKRYATASCSLVFILYFVYGSIPFCYCYSQPPIGDETTNTSTTALASNSTNDVVLLPKNEIVYEIQIQHRLLQPSPVAVRGVLCRIMQFIGLNLFCKRFSDTERNLYGTFRGITNNVGEIINFIITYTTDGIVYNVRLGGILICGNTAPIIPTVIERGNLQWVQFNNIIKSQRFCIVEQNLSLIRNGDTNFWFISFNDSFTVPFEFTASIYE